MVGARGVGFGRPVRSFDWQGIGGAGNYGRGRGAVLIPRTTILETIAAGTVTRTYRFRVFTNGMAMQRAWYLELLGATAGVSTTASVSINGGTAVAVTAGNDSSTMAPVELFEDIHSTAVQGEAEINIAVTSSAGGAVQVVSLASVEWPMAELTDDLNGDMLERQRPTAPVDANSIGAAAENAGGSAWGAINAGRRAGMHHYCAGGTEGAGFTTSSTSFVTVYTASAGPPMLGRYLYSGDTTRSLKWKAYCKVTGGATLTIQKTMVSGDVQSVTTTSAAAGWVGGPATIAVDAEDLAASDGRRSSRFDLLKIEAKVSSGAQTGSIWTVSDWEPLAI